MIAVGFAVSAAAPVVCCFLWCRPLEVMGALLAGLAVTIAAEPVYFAVRTLSETVFGQSVTALWVLEPDYLIPRYRPEDEAALTVAADTFNTLVC